MMGVDSIDSLVTAELIRCFLWKILQNCEVRLVLATLANVLSSQLTPCATYTNAPNARAPHGHSIIASH